MGFYLLPFSPSLRIAPGGMKTRGNRARGETPCSSTGRGISWSSWGQPSTPFGRQRLVILRVLGGSTDVKSEKFEGVTDASAPQMVKLPAAVLESPDEEEDEDTTSDSIPKRWVIVVLCFTAFLLCNMDRVRGVTAF